MSVSTALRLGVWIALAVGALLLAPSLAPSDPTIHPVGEALVAGCLTAGLRDPRSASSSARRARARHAGDWSRSIVLIARSAYEEAVWRALLLGLLVAPLGRVTALTVSTVLSRARTSAARVAPQLRTC